MGAEYPYNGTPAPSGVKMDRAQYDKNNDGIVDYATAAGSTGGAAGGGLSGAYPNPAIADPVTENGDGTGANSLSFGLRLLLDSSGNPSLDWDNRQLADLLGNVLVDWGTGQLFDPAGGLVLDWGNLVLYDFGHARSLDWENHALYDILDVIAIDYNGRTLSTAAGIVVADWQILSLLDLGGNPTVQWALRNLTGGAWTISGLQYPTADGATGNVVTTDGAGHLTLQPPGMAYVPVPAAPTSAGAAGSQAYAPGWFYIAVANNTWQRTALATWVPPMGLIADFRSADFTGATWTDRINAGNILTPTGAGVTKSGNFVDFTGADYLNGLLGQCPGIAAGRDVSASFWVFPTVNGFKTGIFAVAPELPGAFPLFATASQTSGYNASLQCRDALFNDAYTLESDVVPLGVWTNVTLVLDRNNSLAYVWYNGVAASPTSDLFAGTNAINGGTTFTIAPPLSAIADHIFTGQMGNVGIWDKVLTVADALAITAAGPDFTGALP